MALLQMTRHSCCLVTRASNQTFLTFSKTKIIPKQHHWKSGTNYFYYKFFYHSASQLLSSKASSTTVTPNSIKAAVQLLNLQQNTDFTPKELREAYFTAAKLCHPDSPNAKLEEYDNNNSSNHDNNVDEESRKERLTNQFHAITEAYELLQNYHLPNLFCTNNNDTSQEPINDYITKSEDEHFRQACIEFLGIDAEIVEESKRCPLFRQWLKGRTVDAFLWNTFLMKHGGLAPMLRRKKVLNLTEGDADCDGSGKRRRRRKR